MNVEQMPENFGHSEFIHRQHSHRIGSDALLDSQLHLMRRYGESAKVDLDAVILFYGKGVWPA